MGVVVVPQALYQSWVLDDCRNILAILEDLPSLRPPVDHLCELLPRLQARYYSIASSSKVRSACAGNPGACPLLTPVLNVEGLFVSRASHNTHYMVYIVSQATRLLVVILKTSGFVMTIIIQSHF